jgi:hypothetical protein
MSKTQRFNQLWRLRETYLLKQFDGINSMEKILSIENAAYKIKRELEEE